MSCLLGVCVYSYFDVFLGFVLGVAVGLSVAVIVWSVAVLIRARGA